MGEIEMNELRLIIQKRLGVTMVILLICPIAVFAQGLSSFQGTVSDSTNAPVQDGLVFLFNHADTSMIQHSEISNGKFHFNAIAAGFYLLRTNCIGYTDQTIALNVPLSAPLVIKLKQDGNVLKEAQVTAFRKTFEFKKGNIISSVEHTPLASLPDIFEVLAKLPTVQMSNDREHVSIIGRGEPLIYLNNQRISLNELGTLSVNDVKNIEIINHPGAKYEAEGRAVILIRRKVSTSDGYKLDFSEIASQKRFFENRFGINAGIKKNKLEWKLNIQYNHINRWEGLKGSLESDSGTYQSYFDGTSIGPRKQIILGAGLFYQINSSDYFSVNISARFQEEPFTARTASSEVKSGMITIADNKALGMSDRPFINALWNYEKHLKKSRTILFTGGQLAHYERNLTNQIYNNVNSTGFINTENRQQESAIDLGVLRMDLERQGEKDQLWQIGGLLTLAKAKTQFYRDDQQQSLTQATDYNYSETNEAAYIQHSGKFRKTEYEFGMRLEATQLRGGYVDSTNLLINRSFINLFPKASLSIPIDSLHNLTVNISRSIRRPDYANANQVTNYITPFLEFSNNININPTITNELTFTYTFNKMSFELNWYYRTQPAYVITQYDSILSKLRFISTNLESEQGGMLSFTLPYEYKRFQTTNSLSMNYNFVSDPRANFTSVTPFVYAYSNNQYKFPRSYTLMVNGWITTSRWEGIYQRNMQFAIDLSVSKVFAKRFTVTLSANDIFRSLNYITKYHVYQIYSNTTFFENVREVSVSLKYALGKIPKARYKVKEVSEGSRVN